MRKRSRCLWGLILMAAFLVACGSPAAPPAGSGASTPASAPAAPAAQPAAQPSAPSGQPIVIGEIASLSGPFAFLKQGSQGAQMAIDEINAQGGVLGRPLQMVTRDDKSLPEEAAKHFRELVSQGVPIVLGNVPSSSSAAVNPLAKELKTPFFTQLGYSRFLTEEAGHRYFFRLITNDRVFVAAAVDFLKTKPYTKYCTIANDFAYGRSITEGTMTQLKAAKPDIQILPGCEFWVPMGTTDFTPQITAIAARNPEVVMFGGVVSISAHAFVRQAKTFGLFEDALGVHMTLAMPNNMWGLEKPDIPNGILTGADYPYPPVDNAANNQFFNAYKAKFNELPWEVSLNSYETMKLIARAIEKAGKVDREALTDALVGATVDHPTLGSITFRPEDNQSTAGWWFGYLGWDDANGKAALNDRWYVEGAPYLPDAATLKQLRGQ